MPLVFVRARAYAWAVALPDVALLPTSAVTKAEAKADEELLPEDVAEVAAWAIEVAAACALGDELVKFELA